MVVFVSLGIILPAGKQLHGLRVKQYVGLLRRVEEMVSLFVLFGNRYLHINKTIDGLMGSNIRTMKSCVVADW